MSLISNALKSLSSFMQDHQVSFFNGILIVLIAGGEHIFKYNAFKCPCDHPKAFDYVLVIMTAPAIILFIVGVAINNLTWRLLHGCWNRSEETANGYCKSSGYLSIVMVRSFVVPGAWLFITFLDGSYYACMKAEKPCAKDTEEILFYKMESQNIAWISLAVALLVSFAVIGGVHCCDGVTYMQYKYLHSYINAEENVMEKLIEETTKQKAEFNVRMFIANEQMSYTDWDEISKVPDITTSMKEGKKLKTRSSPIGCITPLHQWAQGRTQMTQPRDNPPGIHGQQANTGQQRPAQGSNAAIEMQNVH